MRTVVLLAAALALSAMALPAQSSDLPADVCPSGCAYASIQAAIDAAAPGDTIRVGPGTYAESLTVAKALTLLGAQHDQLGEPVYLRDEDPSVASVLDFTGLAGFAGVYVTAADVTVNGFVLRYGGGPEKAGILGGGANLVLTHNIVRGFTFGAGEFGATGPVVVGLNWFDGNNNPGAASGDGLYNDGGIDDVTVAQNVFTGHGSAAMVFASPGGSDNILVDENRFLSDNSLVFMSGTNVQVTNNLVQDSQGSVVFLGGNLDGVLIDRNDIQSGAFRGVRIAPDFFGYPGPNSAVTITNNRFFNLQGTAIDITAGRADGVVLTGNGFENNRRHVVDGGPTSGILDVQAVLDANAFDRTVVVETAGGALLQRIWSQLNDATAAANAQPAGSTVFLSAGLFPQPQADVALPMTILGAQAGTTAPGRSDDPAVASVLDATGQPGFAGVYVTAADVTIDGLALVSSGASDKVGVLGGGANLLLTNNLVRGFTFGAGEFGATGPVTVTGNHFDANNAPGAASGDGLYDDGGIDDLTVAHNLFTGHTVAAGVLAGSDLHENILWQDNQMVSDNSLALFHVRNGLVTGNTWFDTQGSALFLGGDVDGLEVVDNEFHNGAFRGINVAPDFFGVPELNANILVRFNSFRDNALPGLEVAAGRYAGTLNAAHNWWGHPTGPQHPTNILGPAAMGDAAAGDVSVTPWCFDQGCTLDRLM